MNLRLGRWSRVFGGNLGWCGRCKTSWRFVKYHTTLIKNGGVFPLCEKCWTDLATPFARLPYYRHLMWEWEIGHITDEPSPTFYEPREVRWPEIRAAVLTERAA